MAVLFSKGRFLDKIQIKADDATITTDNSLKYLGLILDRKLTFNKHIQEKIKKAQAARWTLNVYYAGTATKQPRVLTYLVICY